MDKLQRRYRLWSMPGQGCQWPLPGRGTLRSLVWLSFSYEMMTEGRGEGRLFILTCSLSLHVHTEHPLCCSRLRGLTKAHKRQREPSPPRVLCSGRKISYRCLHIRDQGVWGAGGVPITRWPRSLLWCESKCSGRRTMVIPRGRAV